MHLWGRDYACAFLSLWECEIGIPGAMVTVGGTVLLFSIVLSYGISELVVNFCDGGLRGQAVGECVGLANLLRYWLFLKWLSSAFV